MPSGKVAKVVFHSLDDTTSTGVTWIDVTQKTVTADKLATDYTALAADGTDIVGTYEAAPAEVVGVTDTLDEHGGTIRSITAISLAGDTVRPEVLMQGYTAHNQHGNPITGIATSGGITPSGTKQITENGTGIDVLNYASVDVDVPSPVTVSPLSIEAAGTYQEDGIAYSPVTVATGSAKTPTTYISVEPSISIDSTTGVITVSSSDSQNITPTVRAGYISSGTAGEVSVDCYNTLNLPTQAATTVTPSTTSQTAVAAGRYTTGAVTVAAMPSGTAGTPTATKGTVSNHSISITPSVTNTTGYITGGTKNGTAVTVNVAELESGTKSITENGTGISVSGYSAVDVNVDSSTDFVVTLTKNAQTEMWEPNCTYAEAYAAYEAGKNVIFTTGDYNTCSGFWQDDEEAFVYIVQEEFTDSGMPPAWGHNVLGYFWNANGITIDEDSKQYDTSLATSVSSDVISGKYFYNSQGLQVGTLEAVTVSPLSVSLNGIYTAPSGTAYSPVTVNVEGGGGGSAEKKQVNFIDYDGTILYSYTASEANALTALPSNPGHAGLISQGWNWTLAQIKSQLTAQPDAPVWIGQMYITQSGATEIDVTMTAPDLHPYLGIAVNGTVTIDWGDNTTTDTVTGTSTSTLTFTGHEYTAAGDYTISISVVSGKFQLFCNSSTSKGVLSETAVFNRSNRYSNDITAVRLGENVYMGAYAFNYCTALTSITIPNDVTSIGGNTFNYCYALQSITIPNGVTDMGGGPFSGCYALVNVSIPDSVTSIWGSTFSNCYALQSITIPNNVTSIGSSAFSNCYALQSITIPNNVTSIGSSALSCCAALTSITIPDSVTSFATSNAFYHCYAITSVTIPDSANSIQSHMFDSCYALTSIKIPDTVTSIGTYAFNSCYALTSITIPDTVTSIGSYGFNNCYGIHEMHFQSTTPPTVANSNAFTNAFATGATIYVPTGCLEAYTTATNYPDSSTYTYVEE